MTGAAVGGRQGRDEQRRGALYAVAAFAFWGLVPVYYKAVANIAAVEVLAHRVVWSFLLLATLLALRGRAAELFAALRDPRTAGRLLVTAGLVAANWLIFIWGVAHDRVLECSLGYFINPLVNVALGVVFLRERLRPAQIAAVLLAGAAVAVLAVAYGKPPWLALALAGTFALYGLLRKTAPVDALAGLGVETLLLLPLALGFLLQRGLAGTGAFFAAPRPTLLLALAGVVTAVPLLWFVAGCRRLRYATIGILQYLAPSLQFLLGVLAYGEPFPPARAATFAAIWAALALYTLDAWRHRAPVPAAAGPRPGG